MKIRLGELRRIIRESVGGSADLAAYVIDEGGKKTAVIYSPAALIDFSERLADVADTKSLASEAVKMGVVKGYMVIKQPGKPCNGAWQVVIAAGPGIGDVVYNVGFAMSPSGILIPDREYVSGKAQRRWSKESGRAKKPLDDASHPPAGVSSFHDKHHTPDTSDDCVMNNQGVDALNYSYESNGDEVGKLLSMVSRHEDTMSWFKDNSGTPLAAVMTLLKVAGFEMSWSVV